MMPIQTDVKLNQSIQSKDFSPLYFLYGAESHLLSNTVSALIHQIIPKNFEQFNLHQFDGDTLTIQQLSMAYETLPMLASYTCITVKNWNIEKLSKADHHLLCSLLNRINPSCILVFYYTQPLDPKKSKNKQILSIFHQQGVICEFSTKTSSVLIKAIQKHCKKHQVSISPTVCEQLIEQNDASYTPILNELNKLISFVAPGETIVMEHLSHLCSVSIQATAFELSHTILHHQPEQAFILIDRLFSLRVDPIMIIGALSMSMVDLYRLKTALASGHTTAQVISDFHYRSSYRIQKLHKESQHFCLSQVQNCLESLHKADILLKSSGFSPRGILETMLVEMFQPQEL